MENLRPYISEALVSDKYHFSEEKVETASGVVIDIILEGEFQRANKPNKNNRIYEEWLLERETNKLRETIQQRNGLPMGMDHPMPNPNDPAAVQAQMIQRIGMENACALNIALEMHNGVVYGKSRVLRGDYGTGDKLAAFVKAKFKPAVSSRGLGGDPVMRSGFLYVPESYNQVCYDYITNPSTHNAILEQVISEEVYVMTHPKHTKKLWDVLVDLSKKHGE